MFLYFYGAKMIAGVIPNTDLKYVSLKKCDNFDMNDEMEDHHLYDGWEKEENEDGTFYLVFITQENKKYLSFLHMYKPAYYNGTDFCDSLLELDLICDRQTQKFVFENEKLKIVFDNEVIPPIYYRVNHELHFKQYGESNIYLSARQINTDDISNKVCLTENSNMDKQYVLK